MLPDTAGRPGPACTTNGLAECCLEEKEMPRQEEELWIYEPCIFLENDRCTIYQVRPFSCRSFGSITCCAESGVAEAPEWFITLNIVMNQLLEHLDRTGRWGNMIDVLRFLQSGGTDEGSSPHQGHPKLLATHPVPGLLIMAEDLPGIDRFLHRLAAGSPGETELQELVRTIRSSLPGF